MEIFGIFLFKFQINSNSKSSITADIQMMSSIEFIF